MSEPILKVENMNKKFGSQIENGVNEGAVLCNVKTAFSFTPSSIVT